MLQQNFSMLACRRVADDYYLDADMQEACGKGRHLNWALAVCAPQLILYVLGLPVIAVVFLRRNRQKLHLNRVVMFRYGLLYNGYSPKRYYWEGMMAVRKASMAALGVFGGISGVEMQAHVGSALLVLFLIFHLAASPYDTSRSTRHEVLHHMDTIAWLCADDTGEARFFTATFGIGERDSDRIYCRCKLHFVFWPCGDCFMS